MENRSRPIHLYVMVDERGKALIDRKMTKAGIHSINAFMRKIAIDGYVVYADMSDVKDLVTLLRHCGANVNQIARRANEMNSLYALGSRHVGGFSFKLGKKRMDA